MKPRGEVLSPPELAWLMAYELRSGAWARDDAELVAAVEAIAPALDQRHWTAPFTREERDLIASLLAKAADSDWTWEVHTLTGRHEMEFAAALHAFQHDAGEATAEDTTTLYRPVGLAELKLIADSDWSEFPPRLPEQPIFYPVTNEAYARQIASTWNVQHDPGGRGFVTRFAVLTPFLSAYERKVVGGREHEEYWVPAESLAAFNDAIVGPIEVIASYSG